MASIQNRDGAEQCILRAKKYLAQGDVASAQKFLHKSIRLYPTDEARSLLVQASAMKSNPSTPSTKKPEPAKPRPKVTPIEQTGPVQRDYTPEQQEHVQRIQQLNTKAKDHYYHVLRVSNDATEADIKKAYKKLAMKLHPDKNHAPGAEDAFKSVSTAYQCLSNPEKRKIYDQYGTEDLASRASNRFREDELTPEEVFAAFFGGQFPGGRSTRTYHFGRQHHHSRGHQQQEASGLGQFVHFLPLLLVLFFSLLNTSGPEQQYYSLTRTAQFNVERSTNSGGVAYYVDRYFQRNYGRDMRALRQIEDFVEKEFFNRLREDCRRERQRRAKAVKEAKRYRGTPSGSFQNRVT